MKARDGTPQAGAGREPGEFAGFTLRWRFFTEYLIIGLLPLLFVSTVMWVVAHKESVHSQLQALEAVAQIQSERVEKLLSEHREHFEEVVSDPAIRVAAVYAGACVSARATSEVDTMLTVMRDAHVSALSDLSLVDLDGCVHASTDPSRIGRDVSDDPIFFEGLHAIFIGELHSNERGELVRTKAAPITADHVVVGVMVVDLNTEHLSAWAQDYTGLGESGETAFGMLSNDGEYAVFKTPLRFDPEAALERTVPMSNQDAPIVQALTGIEATYEHHIDYRGEPVLAATRYIAETGWGIVVKRDKSETIATVRYLAWFLTATTLLVLIVLTAAAGVMARRRTQPIRDVADAAREIAAGELDRRVTVTRRDELGVLANAVNDMADELVAKQRSLELKVQQRTSQLEHTIETLEYSNRDLERMAVVSAHDLSEPLRKIRVFGERIAENAGESLDERSRLDLDRMVSAAERMQNLIDGLLAYSSITTSGNEFTTVDLGEVAQQVVADLQVAISETGATIEIDDLPSIQGDATLLGQLLQNLLTNSLKYHVQGVAPRVRISGATVLDSSQQPSLVVCKLVVEDNGIGIPAEESEDVFDMFTRLPNWSGRDGAGIGLAICRRVAQYHGGEITIEANTPNGTRVIVTLPLAQQSYG